MSADSASEPLEPELRFDALHDAPAGAAAACARCSRQIESEYYETRGAVVCPDCRTGLESEAASGSRVGRFLRAVLYGLGGAAAGAAIYYAIAAITGYEIGLVAIAVGWLVGRAVQLGSRHRGGRAYQALAVALTYVAIVSTYVPFVFGEALALPTAATDSAVAAGLLAPSSAAAPDTDTLAAVTTADSATAGAESADALGLMTWIGFLFLIAMAAPFLAGFENMIGILIIGFALWQAWQMNARRRLVFTGPYTVGGARAEPSSGPVPS